jgi:hypothetical protein
MGTTIVLLLKEQTTTSGTIKRSHIIRVMCQRFSFSSSLTQHPAQPIPLEYLGLGSFDGPAEVRKERADSGSFISMSSTKQNMYPFIIYHTDTTIPRRYTLYTQTPTARAKWSSALEDAIGVRKARQDANKVFSLRIRFSTWLTVRPSGSDPSLSTTASSACRHALHLPLERT